MPTNFGFKRVGGGGLNGQVYRWEHRGGNIWRCHCAPGLASATRIISLGGGQSYTEYHTWYASGNVVSFPEPYSPYGACGNNPNSTLCGGTTAFRARRGDTWHPYGVAGLSGMYFYIVRAEAGAGDDFSLAESDSWSVTGALGPIIRVDDLTDSGNALLEVTDVQTQFTGSVPGEWHSVGASVVQEVLRKDQPYTDDSDVLDLTTLRVNWDRAEVAVGDGLACGAIYNGDVGNGYRTVVTLTAGHGVEAGDVLQFEGTACNPSIDGRREVYATVGEDVLLLTHTGLIDGGTGGTAYPISADQLSITGSQAWTFNKTFVGYLSFNLGAIVLGATKARIHFTVDGVAQTPREIQIQNPSLALSAVPSGVETIAVQRQDRQTGEWITMDFSAAEGVPYDPFLNDGVNSFKYSSITGRLYFHPLLAGDTVQVVYTLSTPQGMDSYGEPGIYFRTWQYPIVDRGYLKKCDIIDIEDASGVLAAAGDLVNTGFFIGTHGVMR